jgi:hypothetical protein
MIPRQVKKAIDRAMAEVGAPAGSRVLVSQVGGRWIASIICDKTVIIRTRRVATPERAFFALLERADPTIASALKRPRGARS